MPITNRRITLGLRVWVFERGWGTVCCISSDPRRKGTVYVEFANETSGWFKEADVI